MLTYKQQILLKNAFIEWFNSSFRRGVLDKDIFENIDQVGKQIQLWMHTYNNFSPHDSLENLSPIPYSEKQRVAAAGLALK